MEPREGTPPAELCAGRFEIVRTLGRGGMGVVYEALDRERGVRVALKTLLSMSAEHLLRFKNEFRALQDVLHPNLVELGELIEDQGQWFFTMELVEGTSVLRWVRPGASALDAGDSDLFDSRDGLITEVERGPALSPREPRPDTGGTLDEARLRPVLGQLARGLLALHAQGKVHRDVKPSNILVTPTGRVVLLDFGLIAGATSATPWEGDVVVGTPAYMAPEQARGLPAEPAADWYSVGVVLYRALTGRLPFLGSARDILTAKQSTPVLPPRVIAPEVSRDLEELCLALLATDPAARAGGAELLRLAGLAADAPRPGSELFLGRGAELAALDAAFAASHTGPVAVVVSGESGVGKSALCAEWTRKASGGDVDSGAGAAALAGARAGAGAGALLLSGRCFERESVPYKALDGVLDALCVHLGRLPAPALEALLPDGAGVLGRVFPAFQALPAIAARAPRERALDRPELRRRAFRALRELLAALAARRPLIIAIDDLQWGDADSMALLEAVLAPPDATPVLLLCTVRDDHPGAAALLARLPGERRRVTLTGLPPDDARALAAHLLPGGTGTGASTTIATEAAGHPMFIAELARQSSAGPRALRLEDALWQRIAALEPPARALCTLVASAALPLSQQTAQAAADVPAAALPRLLALLRGERLLRTSGPAAGDTVEPYHDRVRAAVAAHVAPAERAELHRRVARTLESQEAADPEAIYLQWREAGEPGEAARHVVRAAERAAEALAFDRAAELYADALALAAVHPAAGPSRLELEIALGSALSNAGRGAEAAHVLLSAARASSGPQAIDLERRAAEQLLRSGLIDEGLSTLRGVLAAVGLDLPDSGRASLPSLLWLRAVLRTRGLAFKPRAGPLDDATRARIDVCWSTALGLSMVDSVRGAEFQTRMLLLSLRAGEPYRVALALALEVGHVSAAGTGAHARTARLLTRARALAAETGVPHAIAMVEGSAGVAAYLEGRFADALTQCELAAREYRERCVGSTWEQDTMEIVTSWALTYQGRFAELSARVPGAVREAEARDDRYLAASLRTGTLVAVPLARDDVAGARHALDEAARKLPSKTFLHQHWDNLLGQCEIDLYEGDGARALERIEAAWSKLKRAFVLFIQISRCEAHFLRGRAALMAASAAAARGDSRDLRGLLTRARRDARRLRREDAAWALPLAHLLEAGAAHLDHDTTQAVALLEQAHAGFTTAGMALHVAVAGPHLGGLVSGPRSAALRSHAAAFMQRQHIASPSRVLGWLAPGFDPARSPG